MATDQESEFRQLYQRSWGFVLGRSRRLLSDAEEARDVSQEVFARAWDRWDEVRRKESPLGWLLVAATNLCLDRLRHRRISRAHRSTLRAVASERLITEPPIAPAEVLEVLLRQEQLTQQIVVHAWLEEMTQDEVAVLLGVSRKTVQRHLDRFRELASEGTRSADEGTA